MRRKAGFAHQTDRITSLVSKWGCSAHERAGQVLWCSGAQEGRFRSRRSRPSGSGAQEGRFRSPNRPNHQSREQMGLFRPSGSGAQEGRFRSRRVIDAVMVGRQSATGSRQQAAGNGQRATGNEQQAARNGPRGTGRGERAAGNGQRAAGSGERTGRRNRLRKGSATKALIIQHLNADNCLQIRIILTTIAKNCRRQDRGKVVADQHYFGFPPTRYKLKFNKNVLIL